ncbi:50S ribosomal protein L35ae [Candidatus Woesearchaeota archaeon]|nr:50S ribosomal protein L35ae [Candidatus Woesearchaeota archaeon]
MKGVIINYKRGVTTQTNNQMIVLPETVDSREKAEKLVGKTVTWTSPAKRDIKGEVRSAHGKKGAIRVLFEKGMPGQAIGTGVAIN